MDWGEAMAGVRGCGRRRRVSGLVGVALGVAGFSVGCGALPFRLELDAISPGGGEAPSEAPALEPEPRDSKPVDSKREGDDYDRHPSRWQQKLKAKYA